MKATSNFKISAVVPLFNGEQFIIEALKSLLNQSSPIDEIIVIDDKSTDRSFEKVQKLTKTNKKIKLLFNSTNKGSSHCRNLGIKESSGNYVLFLDQDDFLCLSFIEQIKEYIIHNNVKEIVGIHTSYFIVDENGNNRSKYYNEIIEPEEFLGYQFVRNRILSNSGAVIKKNVFEKTGFYDESLKFSQDWDLWLRIGKVGTFCCLNKPLTFIRRHSKNTSAKIDGFLNDEIKILQKYDLEFIKKSIYFRKRSHEENLSDFASILLRLKKHEMFEKEIQIFSQKYKDYIDFKFYKGLILIRKKNFKFAAKLFQQISIDNHFYFSAQNNLAICLIFLDDLDSAMRILKNVIRMRQNFKDAIKNFDLAKCRVIDSKKFRITTRPLRKMLYNYD